MRVVSGTARGKKLITPDGMDVRPTIDRVKEAVFSSLQFDLEGRAVLDLFAGSGQLGIEALSRGAKSCHFVDNSDNSLFCVNSNVKNCGFESVSKITKSDSLSFIKNTDEQFDIAFLDPPYNKGIINEVMPFVVEKMSNFGTIVCEHTKDGVLCESYGDFKKVKVKKYGIVFVTYYKKQEC